MPFRLPLYLMLEIENTFHFNSNPEPQLRYCRTFFVEKKKKNDKRLKIIVTTFMICPQQMTDSNLHRNTRKYVCLCVQVATEGAGGRPTPATRLWSSRRSSTSTGTSRGGGGSRSRTRSASRSGRSRSGSRTGG